MKRNFSFPPLTNRFIKSRTMAIVFLASAPSFAVRGSRENARTRPREANEQDTRRQASLIFHKSVCETCSSGGAYVCITGINIQTPKLELSSIQANFWKPSNRRAVDVCPHPSPLRDFYPSTKRYHTLCRSRNIETSTVQAAGMRWGREGINFH